MSTYRREPFSAWLRAVIAFAIEEQVAGIPVGEELDAAWSENVHPLDFVRGLKACEEAGI